MGIKRQNLIATDQNYKYPSKLSKPLIIWLLKTSISDGSLALQFEDETIHVGKGTKVCTITPPSLIRLIWLLLKPDLRLPSSYTKSHWCCENGKLYDFLELLTAQKNSPLHKWFRMFNRNPIRDHLLYRLFPLKVSNNIATHYNTSPEFMRLLLGDSLEYTCAFFDDENLDLESAQSNKVNKVIERLGIEQEHNVLDLGCGWGQIAESVTGLTNAKVTGVNITKNQIAYANKKSSRNTEFFLTDYRQFTSSTKFDRIYSIGMLEHIGRGKLSEYFSKIFDLCALKGKVLVHCIVRSEGGSTNSWIDQEIFPGAYIPELSEIIDAIEKSPLHLETVFTHPKMNYYKTLEAWSKNFYDNQVELKSVLSKLVSEPEMTTILKIWDFYLCGSRLVFNKQIGYCYNVQIVLTK